MGLDQTQTIVSVIISYLCLISVCCTALEDCQRVDDCACKLSDGKEINIRSLGYQGSQAPRFKDLVGIGNAWQYSYNPCYEWSDSNACKNVVACQQSISDPNEEYPIGDASPATWKIQDDAYVVTYSSIAGGHIRTSEVTLKCDKSADPPQLETLGTKPQGPSVTLYKFTLTSKCCCPGECNAVTPTKPVQPTKAQPTGGGGISPGSVLCIIVSVLIVVYLVGGLLFMKFGRHAEGREIMPNYGLWAGLFGSIRDGFVFVFTCGKKSGYDTVK